MKVEIKHYQTLLAAMRLVVESLGGVEKVKEAAKEMTPTALGWSIYNTATFDMFNSEHPAFNSGKRQRVVPYDANFRQYYYDADLKDAHWQTAIMKAMKEIGF